MTGFIACVNNDDGKDDPPANNTISWDAVFIPDDLSSKTLAGIYTGSYSDSSETQGFKESGTYAFCLYEDGTFAETYKGTYTNTSTGTTTKVEKGVWKGTYTKADGDYTNGNFTIRITQQWDSESNDWGNLNQTGTVYLKISGGAFKFQDISYGKKDTSSGNSSSGGSGGTSGLVGSTYLSNEVQNYKVQIEFKTTSTLLYTSWYKNAPEYKSTLNGTYTISGNTMTINLDDTEKTVMTPTTSDNWNTFSYYSWVWTKQSGGNSGSGSGGGSTTVTPVAQTVTVPNDVFFPDDFKDRTISALWKASNSGYNYGLFFFSDNTWLETWIDTDTGNKFYAYKGTWQKVTGDFTSGSVSIIKTHANNTVYSDRWRELSPAHYGTVTAANSKLTVVSESSSYSVTSAPASVPYSLVGVASGGGGSGSGGGNTTGDKLVDTVTVPNTVFYPTDYASYTISALFTKENGTTTYALFFFSDGTWLETSYDADSGYKVYCLKGTWTKTTGDFTSGTFSIARDSKSYWNYANWTADSRSGTGTISNDTLTVTSSVTEMSSYTLVAAKKDTSGSGSGGGSSTSGVTLPSEFQSKTVSAVFYYTEYNSYLNGDETTYLYFFSDNTFITMWSFGNESEPASKGVYSMTGSWTSGSLVVTNQYNYDGDWIAWDSSEDGSPYATGSLSSSALIVTYEGKSQTFPRLQ